MVNGNRVAGAGPVTPSVLYGQSEYRYTHWNGSNVRVPSG